MEYGAAEDKRHTDKHGEESPTSYFALTSFARLH